MSGIRRWVGDAVADWRDGLRPRTFRGRCGLWRDRQRWRRTGVTAELERIDREEGAGVGDSPEFAAWVMDRIEYIERVNSRRMGPPAWLVSAAVRIVPAQHRARYLEEFEAEMVAEERRLRFAVRLLGRAIPLRWELRSVRLPSRTPLGRFVTSSTTRLARGG